MRPTHLELHIKELVLHGFAPGNRDDVREMIERELARLFIEHGVPPSLGQSGEVASLDGGAFEVTPGSKPDAIGTQVAKALYGGISR